jgi:cobyric acid synthase
MLGVMIRRFREEHNLTQPQMLTLLARHGWNVGLRTLQSIERKAREGDDSYEWKRAQVEAVIAVTGYARQVCMFWAGRVPFNYSRFRIDNVATDDISIGMALLATAIGKPDLADAVSPKQFERLKRRIGVIPVHPGAVRDQPDDPYRRVNP